MGKMLQAAGNKAERRHRILVLNDILIGACNYVISLCPAHFKPMKKEHREKKKYRNNKNCCRTVAENHVFM